jgi:RibD C-terminal domain
MRKVLVQELMTLDGFVAGPNHELDFFESAGDFSEVDRANLKQLEGVDFVLLGAATYRMFVDYWPTPQSEGEIVAEMVNTIPKVVFSSTLDRAPWGTSPEARLVRVTPSTRWPRSSKGRGRTSSCGAASHSPRPCWVQGWSTRFSSTCVPSRWARVGDCSPAMPLASTSRSSKPRPTTSATS